MITNRSPIEMVRSGLDFQPVVTYFDNRVLLASRDIRLTCSWAF